jgi:hypothetical protein
MDLGDIESKMSYSDLTELMKHRTTAEKAEQIERQNKVMYCIIFGLLTLSITGIICWYILR